MKYEIEYTHSTVIADYSSDEEAIRATKASADPDGLPSPQPAIIRDEDGREVKRVLV
jgi:hypothetical protein